MQLTTSARAALALAATLAGTGPGAPALAAPETAPPAVRAGAAGVPAPAGRVSGVVEDPQGRPLTGALVLLEPPAGGPPRGRRAVTDAGGQFEITGLASGTYVVVARGDGYAPAWQTVRLAGRGAVEASLRLAPPVLVRGRMVDRDQRAVRGRVVVTEVGGVPVPRALSSVLAADTAADGTFRLPSPAGAVVLRAEARRLGATRIDLDLPASRPEVDLGPVALDTGLVIQGVVRDARGRVVPEALVRAHGPSGQAAEDVTAADGSFVLAGLEAERYRVEAEGHRAVAESEVQAGADPITLVLRASGRMTGTVVEASGAPAGQAQVRAREQLPSGHLGPSRARREVDEASGRFTIDGLRPGTYVLEAFAPERAPASVSGIAVASGRVADVGPVRLGAGGRLRGTVVDASGSAVAGAVVRAAPPRRLAAPLGAEATSDATGAFELRGLSAGTVQVVARHGAYAEGAVEVEVEPAGPPADVRVVLTRGGRIQGRARHRNGSPVLGVVAVHPVEAAAVTGLPPARVPIAADGSFVLDHVPAGRARVVLFSAEPVRPAAAPDREVEVRDGAAASVSFELREVLVGGRITRGGAPAPHLRIGLTGEMPFAPDAVTGAEDAVGEAVTRDDGTYELVVDHPGPARIVVQSADGALRLPARVVEIPDVERHVLDLELGGVAVAGVVVDADSGQPLARAAVVADAWRAAADHSAATAISGPDGRFRIEVDPGTYRVSAHARGYAAAAAEVEVQDGGVSDIRLPLARGGTIKGRVVDERGRAAGGGMVRALSAAGGAAAAAILPDGRFELSGLRDGAHTLVARGEGGQFAVQAGVTAGNEEPTLVLRRGGRLQLRLVGADGAPLPGAVAYLYRVAGLAVPGLSASAVADASGVATLLTPSGEVEVRADRLQGGTIVASGAATLAVEEGRTTTAEVRLARAVAEVPRPAGP